MSCNFYVSSDQPSASQIGLDVLQKGGNAADAAIAMAAAVSVLQPMQCGIGGDCNCMFYSATNRSVRAINGSGRSAKELTLCKAREALNNTNEKLRNGIFVNVPGTVSGMFNCIKHFGSKKLPMEELLAPAIQLAGEGGKLLQHTADDWSRGYQLIKDAVNHQDLLMGKDEPPLVGDKIFAPKLANSLEIMAREGMESFYMGNIGSRIIQATQNAGGYLTLDDMRYNVECSQNYVPEAPHCVKYCGYHIWEMAPNTVGIVTLLTLNILQGFNLKALGHNTPDYIHIVSEALKIAFHDCWPYLCDPDHLASTYDHLLKKEYAIKRRKIIDFTKCTDMQFTSSKLLPSGDTSYLAAVDSEGNACSFIFSLCSNFGSQIIPDESGFVLHSRGRYFGLDEESPNAYGPRKRCLHTIIPAIVTDSVSGEAVATLGVMGLWMQPQGHVQVFLNMVVFGMDPKFALSQDRFCIGQSAVGTEFLKTTHDLWLEKGIPASTMDSLRSKGHSVEFGETRTFGRGHIIAKECLWSDISLSESRWIGAADPRYDGAALCL